MLVLLITGARLHGLHEAGHWGLAFRVHLIAAGPVIVLWVSAICWHITTGEWRQYLPTGKGLFAVIRHHAWGIFRGEAHPSKPSLRRKHNPLQRIACLFLKLVINPVIWISGLLYLTINLTGLDLSIVAWVHVMAAWAMSLFLVVHVYMTTTGETVMTHQKSMMTGYGWVNVDDE